VGQDFLFPVSRNQRPVLPGFPLRVIFKSVANHILFQPWKQMIIIQQLIPLIESQSV